MIQIQDFLMEAPEGAGGVGWGSPGVVSVPASWAAGPAVGTGGVKKQGSDKAPGPQEPWEAGDQQSERLKECKWALYCLPAEAACVVQRE